MRYSVTTAPLSRGADQTKSTVVREKRSGLAAGFVGRSGIRFGSKGVTGSDRLDVPDSPPAFSATAVKVYAVPFESPVIVQELFCELETLTVQLRPFGEEVNVIVV